MLKKQGAFLAAMTAPTAPSLRGAKRRGNLGLRGTGKKDCRAAVIAMDGMYAEKAGAFFSRNDYALRNDYLVRGECMFNQGLSRVGPKTAAVSCYFQ